MNENIMEVTEEVVETNTKLMRNLGIVGGALLATGLVYKYVIKPIRLKKLNEVEETISEATEEIIDSEE